MAKESAISYQSTLLFLSIIYYAIGPLGFAPAALGTLILLQVKGLNLFDTVAQKVESHRQDQVRLREEQVRLQLHARVQQRLEKQYQNELANLRGNIEDLEIKLKTAKSQAREWENEESVLQDRLAKVIKENDDLLIKNQKMARDVNEIRGAYAAIKLEIEETAAALEDQQKSTTAANTPAPIVSIQLPVDLPSDLKTLDPWAPGFTCIGQTLKHTRCGIYFGYGNEAKSSAAAILRQMRSASPGNTLELASLRRLANLLLCPKWHSHGKHDQTDRIAHKWYGELEACRQAITMSRTSSTTVAAPATPVRPVLSRQPRTPGSAGSSEASTPASASSSVRSAASSAGTTPDTAEGKGNKTQFTFGPGAFTFNIGPKLDFGPARSTS